MNVARQGGEVAGAEIGQPLTISQNAQAFRQLVSDIVEDMAALPERADREKRISRGHCAGDCSRMVASLFYWNNTRNQRGNKVQKQQLWNADNRRLHLDSWTKCKKEIQWVWTANSKQVFLRALGSAKISSVAHSNCLPKRETSEVWYKKIIATKGKGLSNHT